MSLLYTLSLVILTLLPFSHTLPSLRDLNSTSLLHASLPQNTTLTAHPTFDDLVYAQLTHIRTTIPRPLLRYLQVISTTPSSQSLPLLNTINMDIVDTDTNTIWTHQNSLSNPTLWAPPAPSPNQKSHGFKPWSWEQNPSDLFAEQIDLVHAKLYGPWHWFMMLCPQWPLDHWGAGRVWIIFVAMDGRAWAVRRGGGHVYEVEAPDLADPIEAARDLLRDLPASPDGFRPAGQRWGEVDRGS